MAEELFDFSFLSTSVSECTDEGWDSDNVNSLSEGEIAEIKSKDSDPFHIELIALYEGMSNNNRFYGKEAVKSCSEAMPGVNMYLGHIEPGTAGWKYRPPVGKIIASKVEEIEINGKKVLAAKARAYIPQSEEKLRSDIQRRMAGNVSILGNARMVRKYGETVKTVKEFTKPLKSIDFCNPGTGGLAHAGVTAVVSEMTAEIIQEIEETTEDTSMAKLTKAQLLIEYKDEITELVGEQVEDKIKDVSAQRTEIAEQKQEFKQQKEELEGSVAEITKERDTAIAERDDWKNKYEAERSENIKAQLEVFAKEHIAEVGEMEGSDEKIIKLASKRCQAQVVDGDLDKSKAAFIETFKAAVEDVAEMAALFGGDNRPPKNEEDKKTKKVDNNRRVDDDDGNRLNSILSTSLAESFKKRATA